MGKGSGTQTTTQTKELDPDVKKAMMDLWNAGQDTMGDWVGYPSYRVAGFTPDQLYAQDQMRFQLHNAQNNPDYRPQTISAGNPMMAGFSGIPGANLAGFTGAGQMAQGAATDAAGARLSGDAYREFMNPYIQSVIDPAVAKMRRERDITAAGAGARAAAGGAYGGSRGALERSQIDRAHNEQVATLVPQLMAQGYDRATASAMANAQMAQQTSLANAAARNNMALNNAQMTNQGFLQDASQRNAMSTNNAQMMNAIMQRNAEMLNQMSSSNAQMGNQFNLQNAEMMNRFGSANLNDRWNRETQAIQQLMQSGMLQQALAQKSLNIPIETLQMLAALRPQSDGSGTTTTTAPDNSPSPLMQVLGMATSLGSAWLRSDEKTKTNVRKIGKDPKTGLPLYEYDDKGDVAAAKRTGRPMPPKRVGPMAQDVKKMQPERVRKIGGKLAIRDT
jgi:hypothetical protein